MSEKCDVNTKNRTVREKCDICDCEISQVHGGSVIYWQRKHGKIQEKEWLRICHDCLAELVRTWTGKRIYFGLPPESESMTHDDQANRLMTSNNANSRDKEIDAELARRWALGRRACAKMDEIDKRNKIKMTSNAAKERR